MMIRSIRVSLTLWYVGLLAAVLIFFGWGLYKRVSSNVYQSVDDRLYIQADGIAETILSFWEAESQREQEVLEAQVAQHRRRSAPSLTIQREIAEGRFPDLVKRWATETGETEITHPVRVLSKNGEVLHMSSSFQKMDLPLSLPAVREAQERQTVYETFSVGDDRWRLITYPVMDEGKVLYLMQTFASLRQADTSLDRLQLGLLWLIPLTLLWTSVIGWFLATLAMRPVAFMIEQAESIGADHLHERLVVPKTGDELERLALAFNNMLGRLERAFRRLRQFSAAASHELRTPLTVMKGELELALRRPRDVEEYQRVLKTQLESLNEMVQIVEQLLLLGRSEAGEGAVEWRLVDLHDLATHVVHALKPLADAKAVVLEVKGAQDLCVRGEQLLLSRLLSNLVDNAIKHTPSGGRISITIARSLNEAVLRVQDTGPGIPAEQLPKIFDRFFQKPLTTGSVGLGLGLCRWIAEAHQGRIEVVSSLGKGTEFSVFLQMKKSSS